jgi:septal ring factor EnvC (AmiA/AmiB activator)
MLKQLQKYFNKEEVEMTIEGTINAPALEVQAMATELSELKASFAEQTALVASMSENLEATNKALEEATAKLAAVAEEKATVEAAALQAKMDARMAKIVETVGDVKATALMEATKELNDVAFDAVLGAMATNMEAEAKSELFTETGVDAQAKPQEEKKPVHFNKFIKTK